MSPGEDGVPPRQQLSGPGLTGRAYRGSGDRRAMQDLASRLWSPGARWHPGDLGWQRDGFPAEPTPLIRLWTGPDGPVLAWGRVTDPDELDLMADPGCPGLADRVLHWFDGCRTGQTATVTVSDREHHLIAALTGRGYRATGDGPFFTLQVRSLAEPHRPALPGPLLPDGYRARPARPGDLGVEPDVR